MDKYLQISACVLPSRRNIASEHVFVVPAFDEDQSVDVALNFFKEIFSCVSVSRTSVQKFKPHFLENIKLEPFYEKHFQIVLIFNRFWFFVEGDSQLIKAFDVAGNVIDIGHI